MAPVHHCCRQSSVSFRQRRWIRWWILRCQKIPRLAIVPPAFTEDGLLIASPQQAESLRRCGVFHFAAASLAPAPFEAGKAEAMLTHRHYLSHQEADHPVKESTGLDLHAHQVALSLQADVLNRGAGVGPAAASTHEGPEIVSPEKSLECFDHQLIVESSVVAVPRPGCEKQIGASPVVDAVAISPIGG